VVNDGPSQDFVVCDALQVAARGVDPGVELREGSALMGEEFAFDEPHSLKPLPIYKLRTLG
jgi:hypothetical protein